MFGQDRRPNIDPALAQHTVSAGKTNRISICVMTQEIFGSREIYLFSERVTVMLMSNKTPQA